MTQITGRSVRKRHSAARIRIVLRRVAFCVVAVGLGYAMSLMNASSSGDDNLKKDLPQLQSQPRSQPQPQPQPPGISPRKTSRRKSRVVDRVHRMERNNGKDPHRKKQHKGHHHNNNHNRHGRGHEHGEEAVKWGQDDKDLKDVEETDTDTETDEEEEIEVNDDDDTAMDDEKEKKEETYEEIRLRYQEMLGDENDVDRLYDFVTSIRKPTHPVLERLTSDLPYHLNEQDKGDEDEGEHKNAHYSNVNVNVNCPDHPHEHYPIEWPLLDIIHNWNPNDTFAKSNPTGLRDNGDNGNDNDNDSTTKPRRGIYQSICRFDHATEMHKIINYRKAEVPFVIRDDPDVLKVVERWNQPHYLSDILGVAATSSKTSTSTSTNTNTNSNTDAKTKYRVEYSDTNSLMYFNTANSKQKHRPNRRGDRGKGKKHNKNGHNNHNGLPEGWEAPMKYIEMTYDEWEEKASQHESDMAPDMPHWYFRVNAKAPKPKPGGGGGGGSRSGSSSSSSSSSSPGNVMFEELPFFQPHENLYMVEPSDARGINCRFGMMGNTAAAHFDGSRNFVMLFGGERRYILSHPKNCPHLALYPRSHPSGRHTAVDWSDPDVNEYPQFAKARANEIVLQAGDVLYLPTFWFHHIISLDLNWQCNARSGITRHYAEDIAQCGFG